MIKATYIVSLLFSFYLIQLSLQTTSCNTSSQCPTGQECCVSDGLGTCYDPSVSKCASCECDECEALPSIVCPIANYSAQAACCVNGCYDPNTTLCCSYHIPHSAIPEYSTCANDGNNVCCGSSCRDPKTETCCTFMSADPQNYICPSGVACCGEYACCNSGELCSSGSQTTTTFSDYCYNASTPTPTPQPSNPTPTPTPTVTVCGGRTCGNVGDACCGNTCYNPSQYSCLGSILCPAGEQACSNACYNPSQYSCCENNLYQVNEISPCNGCGGHICANPSERCCSTSNGNICYDSTKYSCEEESAGHYVLCPSGYSGCGEACYLPSMYHCCDGKLQQLGMSC